MYNLIPSVTQDGRKMFRSNLLFFVALHMQERRGWSRIVLVSGVLSKSTNELNFDAKEHVQGGGTTRHQILFYQCVTKYD